jgi:hypothetical protein
MYLQDQGNTFGHMVVCTAAVASELRGASALIITEDLFQVKIILVPHITVVLVIVIMEFKICI